MNNTLLLAAILLFAQATVFASLNDCNVVWDSPSADANGSMPIGNGDIGLNVWVEPSGDLCFFIGKTDAWDEKRSLGSPQSGGGNEYFSTGYTTMPAFSYPDTTLPATAQRIGWYHRNVESPWLASLKLQKNDALAETEQNPIRHRMMGAILRGDNFAFTSNTELKTATPCACALACSGGL